MTAPGLLVVGGKLKILEKAKALGLRVAYAQQLDQFTPTHGALVDAAVLCDYQDWDALWPLASALRQVCPFDAVLSLTEPGLEPAGRLDDELGFGGNGHEVSRRLKDKLLMRRHLAAVGAAGAVAAAPADGADSLLAFGERHGYPFVVKPTDATASLAVFRVDGPDDVDAVWAKVDAIRGTDRFRYFPCEQFMAEEYLDGVEYSVEAFSFDGRHVVVAVTEKLVLPNFVEGGHAMPARLDPAVEAEVVDCVTSFLDDVGLRRGPTHTEVKLTPDGPRVVESHDRVGGDRINELVAAAFGIDLDTYAIGWPFRLVDELHQRPVARRAAATRFFVADPGEVVDVVGVEEARADPDVVALDMTVGVGDVVRPLAGNWERIGQVVAVGPDVPTAIETCERLVASIKVVTV